MKFEERYNLIKHIGLEIKYGVVVIDFIMTLYIIYLICTNNSTWLVEFLLGFTPFGAIEIVKAGKVFNLCRIHQAMLIHIMLCYSFCVIHANFGLGILLPYCRWSMLIIGVILQLGLIIKLMKCYDGQQENSIDI